MLTEQELERVIRIYHPYLSPIDLKTIHKGTINWHAIGTGHDTATARQFAHALLAKCDELDKINEERYATHNRKSVL